MNDYPTFEQLKAMGYSAEPLWIGEAAIRSLNNRTPRFTPVEKQYDPKAAERARANRQRRKAQ